MASLFWHYIVGPRFQLIVDSGVILPDATVELGQKPYVWFDRDDMWDKHSGDVSSDQPTDRLYRSRRNELAERERGLGRFGVGLGTAPYDRRDYHTMIGKCRFDAFPYPVGTGPITVYRRFSIEAVPSRLWQAVQVWQDGTWVNVPFEKHDC